MAATRRDVLRYGSAIAAMAGLGFAQDRKPEKEYDVLDSFGSYSRDRYAGQYARLAQLITLKSVQAKSEEDKKRAEQMAAKLGAENEGEKKAREYNTARLQESLKRSGIDAAKAVEGLEKGEPSDELCKYFADKGMFLRQAHNSFLADDASDVAKYDVELHSAPAEEKEAVAVWDAKPEATIRTFSRTYVPSFERWVSHQRRLSGLDISVYPAYIDAKGVIEIFEDELGRWASGIYADCRSKAEDFEAGLKSPENLEKHVPRGNLPPAISFHVGKLLIYKEFGEDAKKAKDLSEFAAEFVPRARAHTKLYGAALAIHKSEIPKLPFTRKFITDLSRELTMEATLSAQYNMPGYLSLSRWFTYFGEAPFELTSIKPRGRAGHEGMSAHLAILKEHRGVKGSRFEYLDWNSYDEGNLAKFLLRFPSIKAEDTKHIAKGIRDVRYGDRSPFKLLSEEFKKNNFPMTVDKNF